MPTLIGMPGGILGPAAEEAIDPSTLPELMQSDFTEIITPLRETLIISRLTSAFDSTGREDKANDTWNTVDTVQGDWQPVDGFTRRAEEGRRVKSDAKALVPYDTIVAEGDRVYRADGLFEYVNYVRAYTGHKTILLTRTLEG